MEGLPNEIIGKILGFVEGKDLALSVALVNRRFLSVTRSPPLCTHLDTTNMSWQEAANRIEVAHRNLHTVKIGGKDMRLFTLGRKGFLAEQEVRTIVICSTVKFHYNHILSLQAVKTFLVALNSGRMIRKLIITDSRIDASMTSRIGRLLGTLTHLKLQDVHLCWRTTMDLTQLYVYSPLFVNLEK
jgi:hypothetical protein